MQSLAGSIRHLPTVRKLGLDEVGAGWFTSVMGTGILAICATISPIAIPLAHPFSVALWSADVVLLLTLVTLWAATILRNPQRAFGTLSDPVKAQVWGAPPMACFTIAVGFLKIGESFLPLDLCIVAAQTLFVLGVLGSIFSMSVVPYLMFTQHELTQDKTFGSWLLPIVAPIVASVPAALLSSTWPLAIRGDLLAIAYGLLGAGVILAAIIIVIFYTRLLYHNVPEGALVTTMWLVIGPLGQSIAGIIALGIAAKSVWPQFGSSLQFVALAYGLLVWGFGIYWLGMAIAMTIRATRKHLPFSLGWWAFTFPVGVLTAGTDALYGLTHAHVFAGVSLMLLALLASMWALVASKTVKTAWATIVASTHAIAATAAIGHSV